jgi:hypothetical protein
MNKFAQKLGLTLGLVLVIILVVAYAGKRMIESSPVYEIARLELQKQHGAKPSDLSVAFLRPYKFSEGNSAGLADFVLCDESVCYRIIAQKQSGEWQISTAKK